MTKPPPTQQREMLVLSMMIPQVHQRNCTRICTTPRVSSSSWLKLNAVCTAPEYVENAYWNPVVSAPSSAGTKTCQGVEGCQNIASLNTSRQSEHWNHFKRHQSMIMNRRCFKVTGKPYTEWPLFVCLSACLLVCLFACLLLCLFACLLACLFACLFVVFCCFVLRCVALRCVVLGCVVLCWVVLCCVELRCVVLFACVFVCLFALLCFALLAYLLACLFGWLFVVCCLLFVVCCALFGVCWLLFVVRCLCCLSWLHCLRYFCCLCCLCCCLVMFIVVSVVFVVFVVACCGCWVLFRLLLFCVSGFLVLVLLFIKCRLFDIVSVVFCCCSLLFGCCVAFGLCGATPVVVVGGGGGCCWGATRKCNN